MSYCVDTFDVDQVGELYDIPIVYGNLLVS